jgi:hypothetical protein
MTLYIGYDYNIGGIGDFVYILFQIYCYTQDTAAAVAMATPVDIKVCIPNHPFKHCIECLQIEPENVPVKHAISSWLISTVILDEIEKCACDPQYNVLVYANMNHFLHLYVEEMPPSKRELYRREFCGIFVTTPFIEARIAATVTDIAARYNSIHVRCGDKFLVGGVEADTDVRFSPELTDNENKIETEVLRLREQNRDIYLFCDNQEYKAYLSQKYNLRVFSTHIIHTSLVPVTDNIEPYLDVFCEFVLLGRSHHICAMSKSNFSRMAGLIYEAVVLHI